MSSSTLGQGRVPEHAAPTRDSRKAVEIGHSGKDSKREAFIDRLLERRGITFTWREYFAADQERDADSSDHVSRGERVRTTESSPSPSNPRL